MECPHLRESVKVNRDFIKNKKCELSMNSGNRGTTNSSLNGSSGGANGGGVQWRCLGKEKCQLFLLIFLREKNNSTAVVSNFFKRNFF